MPQNFHILVASLAEQADFNRPGRPPKQGLLMMRYAGAALVALLGVPFPGAATELCPTLSITAITPCVSLVDPTSDLLQKRIDSRLHVAGASPDNGESVWAESREATFQGAPTLASTFFGADYRLGSDLLLGAMVQMEDRVFTSPIDGEVAATDGYFAGPYAAYRLSPNLVLGAEPPGVKFPTEHPLPARKPGSPPIAC